MPSLLTRAEEQELGRRMRDGDITARDELVERNVRLVHSIVRRYGTSDPATDYDDLVQIGLMGLMHALEKWEPERGLKLSTYATYWIRQAVQRAVMTAGAIPRDPNPGSERKTAQGRRWQALRQRRISELDAPLGDSERTLLDVVANQEWGDPEEDALKRIQVEDIISYARLPDHHERILRRWMDGYKHHEAALPEGVSREMTNAIVDKVRRAAHRRYTEDFMSKPCLVDGCTEPRMVTQRGTKLSRCEKHQREYWRKTKTASMRRQSAHQPVSVTKTTLIDDDKNIVETPVRCDCTGDCVYRDVVEALAAKHPSVRELVEAMQRVSSLRKELAL